jgi:hypothetical protein
MKENYVTIVITFKPQVGNDKFIETLFQLSFTFKDYEDPVEMQVHIDKSALRITLASLEEDYIF